MGVGQEAAGSLCEVTATGKQWEKQEVLGLISGHGMQSSFTTPQTSLLPELDVHRGVSCSYLIPPVPDFWLCRKSSTNFCRCFPNPMELIPFPSFGGSV